MLLISDNYLYQKRYKSVGNLSKYELNIIRN